MHKSGASEAVDNSYSRGAEYTFYLREKRSAKLEIDLSLHMQRIVLDDNVSSSHSIHCKLLVILHRSSGWERLKMDFEPFAVSCQSFSLSSRRKLLQNQEVSFPALAASLSQLWVPCMHVLRFSRKIRKSLRTYQTENEYPVGAIYSVTGERSDLSA